MRRFEPLLVAVAALSLGTVAAQAQSENSGCPVTHDQLESALKANVRAAGGPDNGGLPVDEWAAVVDRNGAVCAIAYSGKAVTDQWLGSRAIAIEKANTVNDFSLDSFAISTANLWAPSQPGNSLYSLPFSNPPVAQELYAGDMSNYGTVKDPILGKKPGGIIVFAGGLPLYRSGAGLVGGLGASGNTSCADHNIAWRIREQLGLGSVPNGPSPDHNDEIIYDVGTDNTSKTGWGHPECGMTAPQVAQKIGSGIVMIGSGQGQGPQQHSSAQQPGSSGQKPSGQKPSGQKQSAQKSSASSGSAKGNTQGNAAPPPGAVTVRPANSQVPGHTVSSKPVTSSTSHNPGQLPPLQPQSGGEQESTLPDWLAPKSANPNAQPPAAGASNAQTPNAQTPNAGSSKAGSSKTGSSNGGTQSTTP